MTGKTERNAGNGRLHELVIRRSPRDAAGRIIERGPCDVCGYGNLQYEGNGIWQCDGLADPEDDEKPLIECPRYHIDGEAPYNTRVSDC